jgi:hypothetical protein
LVRICRPLVTTLSTVLLMCPVAVPTAKARRRAGAAILLGGPSSLVSAEPGTSHSPRSGFKKKKPCQETQATTWAGKFSTGQGGLTIQLISGPTAYEAYEAHCTRLHCRHREILKGMLAIFCKSRPPCGAGANEEEG